MILDALHTISRDLLHAARSLFKDRGFAFVCVVSLGIGIGAMVALSTFMRVLTAPARGIDPNGLTEVLVLPQGPLRAKAGEWALEQWSYPDFQALRETDSGMSLAGWTSEASEVGIPDPTEKESSPTVTTLYVTSNYFQVLGVPLARGAGFDAAIDDKPIGESRVVLSHDFWNTRMNADPEIVGKTLMVNNLPHTIVAVTPPDFRGHFHRFNAPASPLFIPLERHPRLREKATARDDRTVEWIRIYGRLNPGVAIDRANALVASAAAGLAQRYPQTNEHKSATVELYRALGAAGYPQSRQVISVLISLAGIVLFIVCLNISGMMLVRGATRERELSIRAALGASRRRLIRHLFFEALLLAFAGGAISAFVLFGVPAIIGWRLGVPVPDEIALDAVNVAIALGLCLAVSLLFGLLPAVRFSRPALLPALKDDVGGGGGRQTIRVHRIAAMVQIGIAVPFLVVAGVMIDRARTAEFGFPTEGLAGARLPMPEGSERDAAFAVRKVRDNLRQASGVQSVAVAGGMPIDFDYREFRTATGDDTEFATAHVTHVAENFLETVGAKLLRGRTIVADDRANAAPVAVISQPLADLLFPGKEAIGEPIKVMLDGQREEQFTVVGVTADFATSQLTTIRPQILLPLPETLPRSVFVIVRGAPGDEPKLQAALEAALRELGVEPLPGVAFPGIVTGKDMLEKSIGDLIAEGTAVGVAGGAVLVLAALGIIGVIGFMVTTRTRELALRVALGATRLRVFGMMLSDVVRLVIPGVAGGLVIGAVLIRTMQDVMGTPLSVSSEPLGVMEPVIYAAASAIAISVALLAGLPAARRATSVQPMVAMRSE
jgi:putative ABC transport system permease protein